MTMRMLIDARHQEETRVAVIKGNRIEEFDFESAEHKQLKGNIYLAKVTRVEPSLQAAFVDYGGNRHGFLAFSEIHPDYYQIPKEDREALLREEAEHAAEEERLRAAEMDNEDHSGEIVEVDDEPMSAEHDTTEAEEDADPTPAEEASGVEESAAETLRKKRQNLRRRYKIQDVIRRRQVLLVQVVKEERGNKGAALTTYLSLAGRYCVLMPNTSHGGGISRKISNGADRKRLKQIMADLNLPMSMGLIVRTAGLSRTKTEIKRDFDYLARLWDEIRETTLKSSAPALVYQDSDLIKRAIRDIYNKDIDEVIVEGDDGYKHAKSFMKLLMPSHVKRVQHYADPVPLFQRFGAEDELSAMYQPVVQLKSGGYVVINPTEALVSIDINSGPLDPRAQYRADRLCHQCRGGERDRPAAPPARHGRPRRDRLHRHGIERPYPQGREGDEGGAEERPRPHPGRPDLVVRADGDEPPAPAHRRARSLDPALPALRRQRPDAHRLLGGPVGAAHARGGGRARPRQPDRASRRARGRGLRAQQEARRDRRDRGALRRRHRGADRRELRGRADERRGARPAAGRAAALRADRRARGGGPGRRRRR